MKGSALITGSAKRLGREIAITLANNGYNIAIHYNNSEKEAFETREIIKRKEVKCEVFKCDLSDEEKTSGLIEEVYKYFQDLNILINSASIFERSPLMQTDNNLFNKTFNTNLKAPFILTRDFAKICKKGNIINILDTKISNNNFSHFAYSLSKKTLSYMTSLSANELSPDIRVNGIAPGLILPPDNEDYLYMEKISEKIPMKKVGKTDDITKSILYLLENDYINGQILYIDGGWHIL